MSTHAFCVHGHFYQPPREDPLTGEIPLEPGAAPYKNWNERILAECYAPNALAGNYTRMSFNVGPTLFDWLYQADPITAARMIAQEREVMSIHGVGNAMAQPYHHTILPLASYQDKLTQVRWGIADFKHRFGHQPTGMWLPETAADDETLCVLADHGIEYTILAPWQSVDTNLDSSHPYIVDLPGGRKITVFFYNQGLSTLVSFQPDATVNADAFLHHHVLPSFQPDNPEPQLLVVASDGELYGHHQKFREKFLSYLLNGALKESGVATTYPALWMKQYPPVERTAIVQPSSWSCHHGVIRWMGACGCTPHGEWKAYMRQAFERIASAVDDLYFAEAQRHLPDPWELRHRYIHVLLGNTSLEDLASDLAGRHLEPEVISRLQVLLCAQNERQRMFTSCGWFFEDFDRIEPRNAVAYAAQAVWLTQHATGVDLIPQVLGWLHPVRSWRSKLRADEVFSNHLQRAAQNTAAMMRGR